MAGGEIASPPSAYETDMTTVTLTRNEAKHFTLARNISVRFLTLT